MFVSQAHSFTQQARLAITLAWVAGYTNIVSILTCGTATSHVSGTVSQWGRDLVEGKWGLALFTTFLLFTFFAGAALSALCTETGRRRAWESVYVLPITLQTILLAAFAVGVEFRSDAELATGGELYLLVGLASLAMGLQNATITRISGGVVRTTHMTGVFTDLGIECVQFLYWLRDQRRQRPGDLVRTARQHPTTRRLALLVSIAGSFGLGAGLGAIAFQRIEDWAMFPPVLFLLWIIYQDIRTPICEIEASTEYGAELDMELPPGMAVYHLRRDRDRRGRSRGGGSGGRVHRLPDLLAWFERLPADKRVVVLDLGDVTKLDDNAALELRALLQSARRKHRRIVISGMTREQYHAMMEAGAGDVLEPGSVCPDLELAIARGLLFLEEHAETPRA